MQLNVAFVVPELVCSAREELMMTTVLKMKARDSYSHWQRQKDGVVAQDASVRWN
jgi:hypothetical protein